MIQVTGSTKLAGAIVKQLNAVPIRIGDVLDPNCDIFINNAHVDFLQAELLYSVFKQWKDDPSKLIINISSRAGLPNLSKGYLYGAQKAALDHLSDNLIYNSDKKCRITTINLGMLEDELPSVSYSEVCDLIKYVINMPKHLEISRVFLQHSTNYQQVQSLKAKRY